LMLGVARTGGSIPSGLLTDEHRKSLPRIQPCQALDHCPLILRALHSRIRKSATHLPALA
jgi:hypothetical protein